MIKFIAVIVSLSLGFLTHSVNADSPLTSTPFYQAYLENCDDGVHCSLLQRARSTQVLNEEMAYFLYSYATPIDQKAALVNALGWNFKGQKNAQRYLQFLRQNSRFSVSADDFMVIAYLTAMDDYFHPELARPNIDFAHSLKPDSFTIAVVKGLIEAQTYCDFFCSNPKIWQAHSAVVDAYTEKARDLKPTALQIISDYLILYRE